MELAQKNTDLKKEIQDRKKTQEKIKYLAYHDPLTGLPNRLLFNDRLQQAIFQTSCTETITAIFFLDKKLPVDRIKIAMPLVHGISICVWFIKTQSSSLRFLFSFIGIQDRYIIIDLLVRYFTCYFHSSVIRQKEHHTFIFITIFTNIYRQY